MRAHIAITQGRVHSSGCLRGFSGVGGMAVMVGPRYRLIGVSDVKSTG